LITDNNIDIGFCDLLKTFENQLLWPHSDWNSRACDARVFASQTLEFRWPRRDSNHQPIAWI